VRFVALALLSVVAAGCASIQSALPTVPATQLASIAPATLTPGAPTAAASPQATLAPAPTAAPTSAPTQAPTAPPTSQPSAPPATVAATSTPIVTPLASVGAVADLLIAMADPSLQGTCQPVERIYDSELGSIGCGQEDLPFTYTLFGTAQDMAAAYNHDLTLGETPPDPNGHCRDANFEGPYTIGESSGGRINCRSHHSSTTGVEYKVIEWTNDALLVLGYFSNRTDLHTWDELIEFWQNTAGPFGPG
jgi:hypothetical protein